MLGNPNNYNKAPSSSLQYQVVGQTGFPILLPFLWLERSKSSTQHIGHRCPQIQDGASPARIRFYLSKAEGGVWVDVWPTFVNACFLTERPCMLLPVKPARV